jgi:Glycosyl hydrolases family 39
MNETFAFEPEGIRLGVVRGISYGLFGPPGEFVPQARALGAGLVRAYLYWSQVEPEPGQYRWDTVDALLGQLNGDEELWITLCSSSPWGTRQPTDFLPPSPALDQRAYAEFVRQVVRHCVDRVGAGRVRYWQCDNEPSNTDLLWAGTAAEYVEQLQTMYGAVKQADPDAAVVLGGCGYDVFSSEPGSAPRQFFDYVAKAGRDAFDLFSVHLYGDLGRIGEYIATARQFMQAHGYLKPVVAGEHAGPQPFEFPEVTAVMQETFAAAFAEAAGSAPSQSTGELAGRAGQDTPERRAMKALYDRMDSLPPRLQMFMAGCPAELEAKRDRISCRQVVMRTVLALAEGVHRTAYWNLAPEYPGPVDHHQLMHLMIGKLPLLGYRDGELSVRHPAADTFALLARSLAGAQGVSRITPDGQPGTLHAFEARRAGRGPLLVLWDHRDPFDGEDQPPIPVTWPWPAPAATITDAFGHSRVVPSQNAQLDLLVTDTPLLIEPLNPS